MAALLLQAGTRNRQRPAGLALFAAIALFTCQTNQNRENLPASDAGDEEIDQREGAGKNRTRDILPHPRTANAWETKSLILTATIPNPKSLDECEAEVRALGRQATNEIQILQTEATVEKLITPNPKFYHWCFYWMSHNLYLRLETANLSNDQRSSLFFEGMRSLWPLARGLDRVREVDSYFRYLRNRYLDISAEIFGRPLEIVTEPLGDDDSPRPNFNPNKAAGLSPNP